MSSITPRDEINTLIQSILPIEEGNEQKMEEITNKIVSILQTHPQLKGDSDLMGRIVKFSASINDNKFKKSIGEFFGFGKAPIESIPKDVLTGVLGPMLEAEDLASLSQTSKTMLANTDVALERAWLDKIMFGASKWKEFYGLEVNGGPIPKNILNKIKALNAENKLKTHKLILIPAGVSLNKMGELAGNANSEHRIGYSLILDEIKTALGDGTLEKSRWILMQTAILPDSRGKRREEQIQMAKDIGEGYDAPTLLEAVILNFTTFAETGERLFSQDPWMYTVCSEEPIDGYKLDVGGFAPAGLYVFNDDDVDYVGVAPVLR